MKNDALYVMPSARPEFRQSLDHSRPFELMDAGKVGAPMTRAPLFRPHLEYRYTDTGENVLVPNVNYNQTKEMRSAHLRWVAQTKDEQIVALHKDAPHGWSPAILENVCSRIALNATLLRTIAADVESSVRRVHQPYSLQSESVVTMDTLATAPTEPAKRRMKP